MRLETKILEFLPDDSLTVETHHLKLLDENHAAY
jgi:hypothetical protein